MKNLKNALLTTTVAGGILVACSGDMADVAGGMMMGAGRVLVEAGADVRDAMGQQEAQARGVHPSQDGSVYVDAVTAQDGASGDATSVDGAPVRTFLTAACDRTFTRTRVLDSDPDITFVQDFYHAEFDVPGLDPDSPPAMTAWGCGELETFGTTTAPVTCPDGQTCSDSGTDIPTSGGCGWAFVSRIQPGKAWVSCGTRSRSTDADGAEVSDSGYRTPTIRLAVVE